ncbi:MAG: hypothetical protein U0263_13670 [Polyangiaceae bacterium]
MNAAELATKLADVERLLALREDLFALTVRRDPPVSLPTVELVENRIGTRIPEPLRTFYLEHAEGVVIHYRIRADAWQTAGYDPEIHAFGQVAIRKASHLGEREWFEGLIQITESLPGCGWFLDLTAPGATCPVVWADHSSVDRVGLELESSERLFEGLIDYLVEWRSELGEFVAPLLRTGRMPKPR